MARPVDLRLGLRSSRPSCALWAAAAVLVLAYACLCVDAEPHGFPGGQRGAEHSEGHAYAYGHGHGHAHPHVRSLFESPNTLANLPDDHDAHYVLTYRPPPELWDALHDGEGGFVLLTHDSEPNDSESVVEEMEIILEHHSEHYKLLDSLLCEGVLDHPDAAEPADNATRAGHYGYTSDLSSPDADASSMGAIYGGGDNAMGPGPDPGSAPPHQRPRHRRLALRASDVCAEPPFSREAHGCARNFKHALSGVSVQLSKPQLLWLHHCAPHFFDVAEMDTSVGLTLPATARGGEGRRARFNGSDGGADAGPPSAHGAGGNDTFGGEGRGGPSEAQGPGPGSGSAAAAENFHRHHHHHRARPRDNSTAPANASDPRFNDIGTAPCNGSDPRGCADGRDAEQQIPGTRDRAAAGLALGRKARFGQAPPPPGEAASNDIQARLTLPPALFFSPFPPL